MASFRPVVLVFVATALVLQSIVTDGYPSGAPTKACIGSMYPHHKPHTPQPLSNSPITRFKSKWNDDGETISVQIESNKPIKGIFVQGRKMNGNEPLGTFVNIPSDMHLVQCPSGDGITHNSRQQWTERQLTWKKPASTKTGESIQFWATIVVDYHHFWIVKSHE